MLALSKIRMFVNGFYRSYEEGQEHQVIARATGRRIKVHACIGNQRPVVVLTGSVQSRERAFRGIAPADYACRLLGS